MIDKVYTFLKRKMSIETYLAAAVRGYLEVHLDENATFLAERLYAEFPTEQNGLLLAQCLYQAGQNLKAYWILRNTKSEEGRFFLGVLCFALGPKHLKEAEVALKLNKELEPVASPPNNDPNPALALVNQGALAENAPVRHVPAGAANAFLLGEICRKTGRTQQAITHFRQAMELDPLMWCAFTTLCDLGVPMGDGDLGISAASYFRHSLPQGMVNQRPALVDHSQFGLSNQKDQDLCRLILETSQPSTVQRGGPQDPRQYPGSAHQMARWPLDSSVSADMGSYAGKALFQTPSETHLGSLRQTPRLETPGLTPIASADEQTSAAPTNKKLRNHRPHKIQKQSKQHTPETRTNPNRKTSALPRSRGKGKQKVTFPEEPTEEGIQPSSNDNQSENPVPEEDPDDEDKENPAHRRGTQREQPAGTTPGVDKPQSSACLVNGPPPPALLELLEILGQAYHYLSLYCCKEAALALRRLHPSQFHTGWVQHQLGRALFELGQYKAAKSAFEEMSRLEPQRLEGLDLLSTTLWHLKDEIGLAYLAQRVLEIDRCSPYSWCVIGNCFSLQREHETALKFFKRCLQVNPNYTYAYTLCGHEYVFNEDFEKAVAAYRNAIRLDHRHYNAWCGLGSIYFRQEKFDLAEYHYRKAIDIHPNNFVLLNHLGLVLHAAGKGRWTEALQILSQITQREPNNPQAKFGKAKILIDLERLQEAWDELERLKDLVPTESEVFRLMGMVCKKMGQTGEARRYYMIALDLKPKDANAIKAAIDHLEEEDIEDVDKF